MPTPITRAATTTTSVRSRRLDETIEPIMAEDLRTDSCCRLPFRSEPIPASYGDDRGGTRLPGGFPGRRGASIAVHGTGNSRVCAGFRVWVPGGAPGAARTPVGLETPGCEIPSRQFSHPRGTIWGHSRMTDRTPD